MVRQCTEADFEAVWEIIQDGAQAYKGVVPADLWKEPYMPREELRHEIESGVVFWGYFSEDEPGAPIEGVMGAQVVEDVTLIRHAYVGSGKQRKGIGAQLLSQILKLSINPVLVGTWTHADWAIHFYEKHGFMLVDAKVKDRLLTRYWTISEQQAENSVVLADQKWMSKLE